MDLIAMERKLLQQDTHFPVLVPDGKSGKWHVLTNTADPGPITNLRYIRDGVPEAVVTPGKYKVLAHEDKGVVMSNTQFEYRTSIEFVERAQGHVLMTGLGLGMLLQPLFDTGKVTAVTVIEQAPEVIKLVRPTYAHLEQCSWLEIIEGDAWKFEFDKKVKFDCAWHDIWNDYGAGNLIEHQRMKSRYRKHVRGLQMCWPEKVCKRMELIERRYG